MSGWTPSGWTPERVELLMELWAQGKTGDQIGKIIGTTRSSVMGKVQRLALPKRGPPEPKPKPVPRAPRLTKPRKPQLAANAVQAAKRRAEAPTVRGPTPMRDEDNPPTARHWEDRLRGECARPITQTNGDQFSCCAPTGGVYCEPCYGRMYVRR